MKPKPVPVFFPNAAAFRAWLEQNHATATEVRVGLYKKAAGRGGLAYKDAVEEALCFGWIDGVLNRIDEFSHMQRFTPRRPGSNWSNLNVAHVERLKKLGKMRPAGLAAFAAREARKTGIYSFERTTPARLPAAFTQQFRANRAAWAFWRKQPPGYRRTLTAWITSAKQAPTRARRLATLIAKSAAGERVV